MLIYGDRYGAYTYINGIRIPLSPRQFPIPFMNTEGPPKPLTPEEEKWLDENMVKKADNAPTEE